MERIGTQSCGSCSSKVLIVKKGLIIRAIYFSVYSQGKHVYTSLNSGNETSIVHMLSAATAGTATAMVTNPIWVAKTRVVRLKISHRESNSNQNCNRHYKSIETHCIACLCLLEKKELEVYIRDCLQASSDYQNQRCNLRPMSISKKGYSNGKRRKMLPPF